MIDADKMRAAFDGENCLSIDTFAFDVAQTIRGAKTLDEAVIMVRNVLNNAAQQNERIKDLEAVIEHQRAMLTSRSY